MAQREVPRAGRTAWRRLALVLAAALLIGSLTPGTPASSQAGVAPPTSSSSEPRTWPSRGAPSRAAASDMTDKRDQIPNLAPSLQDDAGGRSRGVPRRATAGDTAGTIRVTVDATDAAAGQKAFESVGGTEMIVGGDLVAADVRPERLRDLASAEGIQVVSEPRRPTLNVESEGVESTASNAWQTAGLTGAGATVAVIDGGFAGYASRLGTELPASPTLDFGRCGTPLEFDHGTAVAEIVFDMAPDAALRLVCIDDAAEIINALDTLPAAVDVVNISLGWTLLDRGDGSGPISAAVDRARERGVLVAVAAGNYGGGPDWGTHRHQSASGDTPGPSRTDLVNMPGGDDGLAFLVAPGETGFVSLQWDAWPNTAQDFDLYIEDTLGNTVAESDFIQNGVGGNDPPIEFTPVTNTSGVDKVYFVTVNRFAGTAAPRMDVFFDGGVLASEASTGSSISDPAVARGAMAVGAHCYSDGIVEFYSSLGPTIDGRVKPDISGPDGSSGSVYGDADACTSAGFFGTSAAAPHAAGAAAQLLEANPDLDVAELQRLLERTAVDAGPTGLDNSYGAGRLHLGNAGDAFLPAPQAFTGMEPTRLLDSRPGSPAYPGESGNRVTPVPAGGTLPVRVRGGSTGVPPDAVAVVLNVTVVGPTSAGYVTVFPGGSVPNTSNVNFGAGQTVPVHVTATVGADDRVRLFNAAGSTNLIVDIAGWYGPTGDAGPGVDGLTALASPARVMDTRGGVPMGYAEDVDRITPVGPSQTLDFDVTTGGVLPADTTAVILNLTGISPTSGTYLTVHPGGGSLPTTSNLNPRKGQTVANLVVVPVGLDGAVSVYNAAGSIHMAIDVLGYFRAGTGSGYVALDPPTRHLDTRTGTGLRKAALSAGGTYHLKVARYEGVPGDAAAVMLSVVAVSPSSFGYVTVFPGGSPLPNASNINFPAGATTANAVMSRIGATGRVGFYNALGNTHVISDLAGYFIDPANVQLPPP